MVHASDDPSRDLEAAVSGWRDRLAPAGAAPSLWDAFAREPAPLRAAVTEALKQRVDELVRNEPPAAVAVAEALVRAATDLPELEPLALRGRAVATHFNGHSAAAIADFERAADLYEAQGRTVECARTLRSLVDVAQLAGRSDQALACAARAEALLEGHDEPRLLAQLWHNVGNVHTRLDDYAQAEAAYRRARQTFEQLGDDTSLAFSDFNLAVVAMNANRTEDAEAAWARARAGMERAGMGLLVADCDYNVAYLRSRAGHFERAIDGLEQARLTYEANGKPSGPPLCDLDLAEINLRLGACRDARRQAAAAATVFERLDMGYELARAEVLSGLARARLGEPRNALEDLTRAEERFELQGNLTYAAFVGLQRAHVQMSAGNAGEVLQSVRAFRATLQDKGSTWLANLATLTLARALLLDGQPRQALDEVEALSSRSQAAGSVDDLLGAILLRLRADALAALGDRDGAIAALEEAVGAIDSAWGHVPRGDVRIAFFRGQHPAFVDMTCLLLEAGRAGEALLVYEHGRSRSMLDTTPLANDPAWRKARERLDWLLTRQLDAELGPLSGGNELRRTSNTDGSWSRAVADARNALAIQVLERRARPTQAPGRLHPEELATACRPGERVLSFITGPRGVHALWMEPGDDGAPVVSAQHLEVTSAELERLRADFWFQARRPRRGPSARRQLRAVLAELGERLMGPALAQVPDDGQALMVVPSGPLHDLPLHACELDGQPLATRFELTQALSVWHLARIRSQPYSPRSPEQGMWCSGATLGVLPAVAHELAHLEGTFPGRVQRLDAEQLVQGMTTGSVHGSLLHIAAHGRFEASRPKFSAVCLGERFLLAHDVAALSLDLDLVVLSGCETGRSLSTGGDELIGLPRAFLGAGARSVLGTLWPVGDADAARFMESFYNQLATGTSVRRALTAARRKALAATDDPVAWAAFTMFGDPDVALSPSRQHLRSE